MSSSKPKIGVTGPDHGGTSAWWFTKLAVWLQGGQAIRIRPSHQKKVELDGLILGGGADISPDRYGEKSNEFSFSGVGPNPRGIRSWLRRILSILFYPLLFLLRKIFATKSTAINSRRDEVEFNLLKKAIKQNIPVLGICRGAQLINVQFGGNLHRDITSFYGEVPRVHTVWPKKKVKLTKSSRLARLVDTEYLWVNALHHQAVDATGQNIQIVAREENGLPQAIEHTEYEFMLGVQWHPEYMPQIPQQRQIFKSLVLMAKDSDRKIRPEIVKG